MKHSKVLHFFINLIDNNKKLEETVDSASIQVSTLQADLTSKKQTYYEQTQLKDKLLSTKDSINSEISHIKGTNQKLKDLIKNLEKELRSLENRRENETSGWREYIESIIETCKRLTSECLMHAGDQAEIDNATELKQNCDEEMSKIENLVRSKAIMEKVMNDRKKDVQGMQGREKSNVIRINQLVKEIEILNGNVKEVKEKICEQEKGLEDRKRK